MEEWMDIEGYEGLYQVSNEGRVKTLGNEASRKEKILRCGINRYGYKYVVLSKDNTPKLKKVYRLVADAFIPNPEGKPCVDHTNTIRTDDRACNLRWCTYKENMNNEITKENCKKGKLGKPSNNKGHKWTEKTRENHKKPNL